MDKEFIQAVKEMRKLQDEYFRTRDKEVLRKCKSVEKQVDKLLQKYENPQKSLFQ